MRIDVMPIYGIYGLDDCYITKDGRIFKQIPTQRTKDGVEFIKRNHSAYSVKELADRAFGIRKEPLTKIKR